MPLDGFVKTDYFSGIAATWWEVRITIVTILVWFTNEAYDRYGGYQIQLLH
jgi:hypothetical protein